MKRYTLYFPLTMIARLNALSKDTGLTVAELIRRAIQNFLDGAAK